MDNKTNKSRTTPSDADSSTKASPLKVWATGVFLGLIVAVSAVELAVSYKLAEHVDAEFFGKMFDRLLDIMSL